MVQIDDIALRMARLVLLALLTLSTPLALAQGSGRSQDEERSWQLGFALGQGHRSNPLVGGEDIDIDFVIDFSWYGDHWFFDNGDLGYTLFTHNNLSLSSIVTFNNERNYYNYLTGKQFGLKSLLDNSLGFGTSGTGPSLLPPEGEIPTQGEKSPIDELSGDYLNINTDLASRHTAINGGFELLFISPYGDVQAQVLSDISSTHEGQEAWLSWSYPWFTRRAEYSLTLGMEWKSQNLIGYYFGVEPDESFKGRPVYAGASGTNTFVRFSGRYALTNHITLVGMVEREQLSSAISASPIVDAEYVDTVFAGLFYAF